MAAPGKTWVFVYVGPVCVALGAQRESSGALKRVGTLGYSLLIGWASIMESCEIMGQSAKDTITKWALFEYRTQNLGDEIQSIAARRFLPSTDQYIDRDALGHFQASGSDPIGIIANAWYLMPPFEWPPREPLLVPKLISMHFDIKNPRVREAFSTNESRSYMERFGPVGARDPGSLDFLRSLGIEAWLSGCLTLTLQGDPSLSRGDFVLAIDVPESGLRAIREQTDRPVICVSPYQSAGLDRDERFRMAEFLLLLYQTAHAVVATRLHAVLPCLAFQTPVFLIKTRDTFESSRFDGFVDLVRSDTAEHFASGEADFDIDSPSPNSDEYLGMREALEKSVRDFTGYDAVDAGTSFLSAPPDTWLRDPVFLSAYSKFLTVSYPAFVQSARDQHLLAHVRASDKEVIRRLQDEVAALRSSHSYRIGQVAVAPIRTLRKARDLLI